MTEHLKDWLVKGVFLTVGVALIWLAYAQADVAVDERRVERDKTVEWLRSQGISGPFCDYCGRPAGKRVTETYEHKGRHTKTKSWVACDAHTDDDPKSWPTGWTVLMVLGGVLCLGGLEVNAVADEGHSRNAYG